MSWLLEDHLHEYYTDISGAQGSPPRSVRLTISIYQKLA